MGKEKLPKRKLDHRVEPTRRVLVVDDEETIRELIADTLREADFHIRTAANGARALEIMHDWVPHLIVLDLMMPRLDGLSFVELMRLNPKLSSIPVVLVTAAYAADAAAEHVGAQAYLTKPFELDELLRVVHGLAGEPLPLVETQPRAEQQLAHEA